jgi:hypothetical protein
VFDDWVSLSLNIVAFLDLANLYILLHQSVMKALRNVGFLFCIDTTDQPVRLNRIQRSC